MWKPYWKLNADPFLDGGSPFVGLATHREAVARLVESIESGRRLAVLRGGGGTGKSRVLAQALAECRSPSRKVARLTGPLDGTALFGSLATALGARVPAASSRSQTWRALLDAVRLCRWQRLQVVLAIDDCQALDSTADQLDLERLRHLDPLGEGRLTVVQVHRDGDGDEAETEDLAELDRLAIRLGPLTRSECVEYLTSKLAAAGRAEPTFTPRACNRLLAGSEGNPRRLDRLATLALMAGAVRGVEIVTPEVVDGITQEFVRTPSWA